MEGKTSLLTGLLLNTFGLLVEVKATLGLIQVCLFKRTLTGEKLAKDEEVVSVATKDSLSQLLSKEKASKTFCLVASTTERASLVEILLDISGQISAENQSEHSETAANEENKSEISKEESINSENKEDKMTTYITKIPEFNREDIETSPQEWLDQVTKAGDTNGWNAARMLRTIPYFLKETAGEWFENLAVPFND
ncbi:hypothetical protein G9A89_023193 [Geosiphon pyriformis]|nr:hypothetical protein G9A89_023193 [Geosiphon pyriformis]